MGWGHTGMMVLPIFSYSIWYTTLNYISRTFICRDRSWKNGWFRDPIWLVATPAFKDSFYVAFLQLVCLLTKWLRSLHVDLAAYPSWRAVVKSKFDRPHYHGEHCCGSQLSRLMYRALEEFLLKWKCRVLCVCVCLLDYQQIYSLKARCSF